MVLLDQHYGTCSMFLFSVVDTLSVPRASSSGFTALQFSCSSASLPAASLLHFLQYHCFTSCSSSATLPAAAPLHFLQHHCFTSYSSSFTSCSGPVSLPTAALLHSPPCVCLYTHTQIQPVGGRVKQSTKISGL